MRPLLWEEASKSTTFSIHFGSRRCCLGLMCCTGPPSSPSSILWLWYHKRERKQGHSLLSAPWHIKYSSDHRNPSEMGIGVESRHPFWPPDLQSRRSQMLAVGVDALWLRAGSAGQRERIKARFNWNMQVESIWCCRAERFILSWKLFYSELLFYSFQKIGFF